MNPDGYISKNKKIAAFISLVILSVISSFIIAQNHQRGLGFVFWSCMIPGMAVFFIRYIGDPEKMFFLFMFIVPFMNILTSSLKYVLPLGFLMLIFLLMLIYKRKITIKNLLDTWNGRLLVIYVLLNFIILPYSMDIKNSLTYVVSFPFIILLWDWIVQYFDSREKVIKVIKMFNFIGMFYSLIGILILGLTLIGVSMTGYLDPYYYTPVNRFIYIVSSAFVNPNTHGLLLMFTLPSALYLAFESRDKKHILGYIFCFLIMGLNLFLTFSRSSWGSAFIAVAIIFMYKYKRIRYIGIVAIVVLVLAFPTLAGLQIDVGKFKEGIFSLSSRGLLWSAASKAISVKPITGYGVGNSMSALSLYSEDIMGRTPHNTYLRMWVEMGIFGLAIYVVFIFNIIWSFIKSKKRSLLMATILGIVIGSLFQQVFETMLLGGLSIIGCYFFIFSALFESLKNTEGRQGESYD